MPARRRKPSNAMLYTLIIFVGLFIITTTIAVIYYVRAEDYRTRTTDLQSQIDELANSREQQTKGTIIGTRLSQKSWLGTMVDYLDTTVSIIVGGVPQPTSSEVKVNNASTEFTNALNIVNKHIDIGDPNTTGLIQIVKGLTAELESTKKLQLATQEQLNNLQEEFNSANQANFETEQALLAEKDILHQLVNKIQEDYNDLQVELEQTTEERVKNLMNQLEMERANLKTLNDTLLKTQAQLRMSEDIMRRAQQEVMNIKPPPDREVLAYKFDGRIILVNNQAKTVHINIGSDNHVYRGLTFTVYDRGTSIPRDGKGKAEIEVFDVAKNYSVARIIQKETTRPILYDDIVANLIWDSDKTNVFVIAGDFDLDNNGNIDDNAIDKMKIFIEKWGGRVVDTISIDTDFLVLGQQPLVLEKPTFEELEADPSAMERYENSLERLNNYNDIQARAQDLWIPIFTYERFLYFIGFKTQISRAGAF